MLKLEQIKPHRDQQVLDLLIEGCSNRRSPASWRSAPNRETAPVHLVSACRYQTGPQACHPGDRGFLKRSR